MLRREKRERGEEGQFDRGMRRRKTKMASRWWSARSRARMAREKMGSRAGDESSDIR